MASKEQLRKKFLKIRKKKYFEVSKIFFNPVISILNKLAKKNIIYLSCYYPSNFEVNTNLLFKNILLKKKVISLLPSVINKKKIQFYKWNFLEPLEVNKFGMLQSNQKKKYFLPDVALIPLLAFDKYKNRLGYGGGYYDNFLNKYLKMNKNILTIGVAFSFQKYHKIPTSNLDVKLNYIITEKGLY